LHEICTTFQTISLCDYLKFELVADEILLTSDSKSVPTDEKNLIIRAANQLRKRFSVSSGARIHLQKIIPSPGGLGGGSSDAATTLMALNHLWQAGRSREELMALGLQLGADVPFFIFGSNAFAEGVGEKLTAVDGLDCWFVVLEPGVAVPTPAIFCSPELTRNTKPVRIADFSGALQNAFGKNDMQAVAAKLFPEVEAAISWLGSFGNARMTGSGACVFMPCQSEQQADAVLEAATGKWKAWKARGITRHPLSGLRESL